MWAIVLPLISLALIPLAYLSDARFVDRMDSMEASVNAEAVQFVEYSFSVGKKMTFAPKEYDVWEEEALPLPEEWRCGRECPWTNQRDPTTGIRYAYGVPRYKDGAYSDLAKATRDSPSFGIKRNGKFEGGLALGGFTPPPWIPEGAYVFAAKQRPYIR